MGFVHRWLKDVGLAACAERLSISMASAEGSSIQELYERGEYKKIIQHDVEDVRVTERLYYRLMKYDFDPFTEESEIA